MIAMKTVAHRFPCQPAQAIGRDVIIMTFRLQQTFIIIIEHTSFELIKLVWIAVIMAPVVHMSLESTLERLNVQTLR